MRATPSPLPRISWTSSAIGSTATRYLPTPQIMLAMGILGGGAVGVVLVCASAPSHDDSSTSAHDSATAGSGGSYEDPTRAMDVTVAGTGNRAIDALHLHHRRHPIIIQQHQFSMPTTIPSPIMNPLLATSSSIQRNRDYNIMLATSDASAERSASMAAAAQMNSNNSSSQNSNNSSSRRTNITQEGINTTTTTTTNHVNRSSHPPIRPPFSPVAKVSENNKKNAPTSAASVDENDDSYPTFTQYHHSLLKKYLTPQVWSRLSHLHTSFGTTIEDIIRPGLALPMGASPPRRVGVLVGDAECYIVFRELLDPIISEYHGIDSYEEWMDPELPMEGYFRKMAHQQQSPNAVTKNKNGNNSSDIMKSSGADDDSDEDGDSFFFLDEEGDLFEEDVILSPTTTTTSSPSSSHTTTQSTTITTTKTNSTTTAAPSHVEAIASKRKGSLRRHPTIINNPRLVTNRVADPDGKYIVSTRIRVARSLDGIRFPSSMSRSDRRYVERLIGDCTRNFRTPRLSNGSYTSVLSMTNDRNLDLIERHILFDNPNEWTIASGLGRDWPDGRALYANVPDVSNQTPDFMIWVNEEDHLRIMCLRNGGDIQGVFTTLWNGLRELERELSARGWHFVYDARLGYLTSCPTNVGTAMRASVHVRLVNLGRLPGFFELVERLKLEVRGMYGETDRYYTGIFDISNAERLGKSEVHLINVMVEGVAKLIELERRLEAGEQVDISEIARS